jgi:hypothetical protein
VFGASLLAAIAGSASAQTLSWQLWDASGDIVNSATGIAQNAPISLGTLPVNVGRVTVFSDGGLAGVGAVTFSASQSIDFVLGSGQLDDRPLEQLALAAANWAGLNVTSATQANIRFSGAISGNLTGPVIAGSIVRLQVGGTIQGAVDVLADPNTTTRAIGAIVAGSTSDTSTITADGSIGPITITGVDGLKCVVSATRLETIDVEAGGVRSVA